MTRAIIWFRQDLRLCDNPAFVEGCNQNEHIILLYVFDENNSLLGQAQGWWLYHSLMELKKSLHQLGLELVLRKGDPLEILVDLVNQHDIQSVYWNRCYEPSSIPRDKRITQSLQDIGIEALSFQGNLMNEPWTICNQSGDYFKVFTPYWKSCRTNLIPPPPKKLTHRPSCLPVFSEELNQWKLLPTTPNWASAFPDWWTPGEEGAKQRLSDFMAYHLKDYKINRDYPAKEATSRLSPHLHFGEISCWDVVRAIECAKLSPDCDLASAECFLSELGWREFSYYLLYHFPTLASKNFKPRWDPFPWENQEHFLTSWQKGITGYPIVDAGMRQLWATGYMHNRVRMIVASFLTKDLLIDWRLGADWFLDTLVDADLANNSASWQWVAGSGADAAPYFRIFNPVLQSQKWDPDGTYIRQWVPELSSLHKKCIHAPWTSAQSSQDISYPPPIIQHQQARDKALNTYHQFIKKN